MSDRVYLLPPVNYYKANLHCHSTFSDGSYTPQQLKEIYMKQGYSVIAYSDHDRVTPHLELMDEKFVPLTAGEFSVDHDREIFWRYRKCYHLNFIAKDKNREGFIEYDKGGYTVDEINGLIARAAKEGFLCQYNHPRWSMQDKDNFIGLEGLFSFEVFNTSADYDTFNGDGEYEYDLYCKSGGKCGVSACDDNHRTHDMCESYTMIAAEKLTYENVIAALEKGDFYASRGPEIKELYVEDGVLHLACSPVQRIGVFTDSRFGASFRSENLDDSLKRVEVPLDFDRKYIRIVLVDSKGKRAWSRAYFGV